MEERVSGMKCGSRGNRETNGSTSGSKVDNDALLVDLFVKVLDVTVSLLRTDGRVERLDVCKQREERAGGGDRKTRRRTGRGNEGKRKRENGE
jgi:hypothetical protein